MTKTQQQLIIKEMKQTIGYMRDAEQNADSFYSALAIRNNMHQYFTGLAYALSAITGNDYIWSTHDNNWSLVVSKSGNEIQIMEVTQ